MVVWWVAIASADRRFQIGALPVAAALLQFASAFEIVPFDDTDAEVFGVVRAILERAGRLIGPYDMQFAAQALARDLVLVTNNTGGFARLPGLRLEDWTE